MLHPSRKPQGCKKTALHCPRKGQPGLCADCAGQHVSQFSSMAHPSGFSVLSIRSEKLSQAGVSGFLHNLICQHSNLLGVFHSVCCTSQHCTARPGRGLSSQSLSRSLIIIVGSSVVSVLHRSFLSAFVGVFRKTDKSKGMLPWAEIEFPKPEIKLARSQ